MAGEYTFRIREKKSLQWLGNTHLESEKSLGSKEKMLWADPLSKILNIPSLEKNALWREFDWIGPTLEDFEENVFSINASTHHSNRIRERSWRQEKTALGREFDWIGPTLEDSE